MTLKQQALARALTDGSASSVTEAAAIAGYAHRETASKMLRNPTVRSQIETLTRQKLDRDRSLASRARRAIEKGLDLLETAKHCSACGQSPVSPASLIANGAIVLKSLPELEQSDTKDPREELCYRKSRLQAELAGMYLAVRTMRPVTEQQAQRMSDCMLDLGERLARIRALLRCGEAKVPIPPTQQVTSTSQV